MKCLNCGEEFTPAAVNQKYCCQHCKHQYYWRHDGPMYFPSVTFQCSCCGKTVVTDGKRDKRTRFCSAECERKYWRRPPYEHETKLINFNSVEEYARWEKRTNE